jgi:hypothetical protein
MHSKLVSEFLNCTADDCRITSTHIALYAILVEMYEKGGLAAPFSISRSRVMKMSKIRGKTTYHNHMSELVAFGFIKYEPSYHPRLGSMVWILSRTRK